MVVVAKNSYFDHNDVSEPVKTYVDFSTRKISTEGVHKFMNVHIQKNCYKVYDNYFGTHISEHNDFYSLEKVTSDIIGINDHQGIYLTVAFSIYDMKKTYESSVYSIFDLISELGGAFEIFEIACKFFFGYYVNKLFYFSVINSMNKQTKDRNCVQNEDTKNDKSIKSNKNDRIQEIYKINKQRYQSLPKELSRGRNAIKSNSKYDYFDFAYNLL